jgi:transcriptional regulator with XRE-family HTH domain
MLANFGSRILELRTAQGLTQEQFATRIGVTQPAISQIETQKRRPSLDTAHKISKSLGLTIEQVLYGESGPSES